MRQNRVAGDKEEEKYEQSWRRKRMRRKKKRRTGRSELMEAKGEKEKS